MKNIFRELFSERQPGLTTVTSHDELLGAVAMNRNSLRGEFWMVCDDDGGVWERGLRGRYAMPDVSQEGEWHDPYVVFVPDAAEPPAFVVTEDIVDQPGPGRFPVKLLLEE